MDKSNTEAHGPCANFNCWVIPFLSQLVEPYRVSWRSTEINDNKGQIKWQRNTCTENGVKSATDDLSLLRLYNSCSYFEWMKSV